MKKRENDENVSINAFFYVALEMNMQFVPHDVNHVLLLMHKPAILKVIFSYDYMKSFDFSRS